MDISVSAIKSSVYIRSQIEKEELQNAAADEKIVPTHTQFSNQRKLAVVIVLLLMNIINMFDRSVTASVLQDMIDYYDMSNTVAGFLKTSFVIGLMIGAPFWGYLGSIFYRKWIVLIGLFFWSLCVLAGTFSKEDQVVLMFLSRFFAGFGAGALGSLASTILADMFSPRKRPLMINLYIFCAVMGTSLSYVGSSTIKNQLGGVWDREGWKWAMTVPSVAMWPLLLLGVIFFPNLAVRKRPAVMGQSSWFDDVKYLISTPTYVCVILGTTMLDFCNGAFKYWVATMIGDAIKQDPTLRLRLPYNTLVGVDIGIGGTIGCLLTAEVARQLKVRGGIPNAQPLLAGCITIFSGLLCLLGQELIQENIKLAWVVFCFAAFSITSDTATTADVIMAVSPQFVRPTASSLQTLFTNLLGDGFSPLLIGAISDGILSGEKDTYSNIFNSLSIALLPAYFIATFGGMLLLVCSLTYKADIERARLCGNIEEFRRTTTFSVHYSVSNKGGRIDTPFGKATSSGESAV